MEKTKTTYPTGWNSLCRVWVEIGGVRSRSTLKGRGKPKVWQKGRNDKRRTSTASLPCCKDKRQRLTCRAAGLTTRVAVCSRG